MGNPLNFSLLYEIEHIREPLTKSLIGSIIDASHSPDQIKGAIDLVAQYSPGSLSDALMVCVNKIINTPQYANRLLAPMEMLKSYGANVSEKDKSNFMQMIGNEADENWNEKTQASLLHLVSVLGCDLSKSKIVDKWLEMEAEYVSVHSSDLSKYERLASMIGDLVEMGAGSSKKVLSHIEDAPSLYKSARAALEKREMLSKTRQAPQQISALRL